MIRSAAKTVAAPHHAMKEANPILSENMRLGKSLPSGLTYDNQQTGASLQPLRLSTGAMLQPWPSGSRLVPWAYLEGGGPPPPIEKKFLCLSIA